MACITSFFHAVDGAEGWLWRSPQILSEPPVSSHAAAAGLSDEQRAEFAQMAADSLNVLTKRTEENQFLPMESGNDRKSRWAAKVYVNITQQDLPVQITGPRDTIHANKQMKNVILPGGHGLVATIVCSPGEKQKRPPCARQFGSKKHGTKGVVFVGTVGYEPSQHHVMVAAAPVSSSPEGTSSQRGPRTRSSAQKQQLKLLNDAYKSLGQGPRECLNELLDIKQSEVDSVFAMKATKRRKVQLAFNLLSWCDEELYAMARSIADDESGDEEDDQGEAESAPEAPPSQDSSSQGDAQMGGKKAATDAAYAMKMKGMKGMKTIAPSGRKAPLVSLH